MRSLDRPSQYFSVILYIFSPPLYRYYSTLSDPERDYIWSTYKLNICFAEHLRSNSPKNFTYYTEKFWGWIFPKVRNIMQSTAIKSAQRKNTRLYYFKNELNIISVAYVNKIDFYELEKSKEGLSYQRQAYSIKKW